MEVVNILPTPVAIIPCPFHAKVKETILSEIEKQNENSLTYNINSKDLKHIGHYSVLQDDEKYGRFTNWIEQQAEYYAKEEKGDYIPETVQVTDSWYNMSDDGGKQYFHHHCNSYISGIYYVNFDREKGHVPTSFTNDSKIYTPHAPVFDIFKNKLTQHNQDNLVFAKEGELLLFPSQIAHGYENNKGDGRITLSMNIMPTVVSSGDYGWRCVNLTPQERLDAFIISKEFDA